MRRNVELRRTNRVVAATIVFDSLRQPIPGTRGVPDARQLLMRAEELDIHLKISTNPAQHQIIGQIFARNSTEFLSGVRLHLSLNGELFRTTSSDNFGQFQFDEVPQGAVRLHLELPHLTIVGGITIGEQT